MKTHMRFYLTSLILLLMGLLGLIACNAAPPPAVAVTTITAEEGATLIQNGRVTEIQVAAEWLYLQLDDQSEVRVPRADTPEGGLLAPFQPYGITPVNLLAIPIIPRE